MGRVPEARAVSASRHGRQSSWSTEPECDSATALLAMGVPPCMIRPIRRVPHLSKRGDDGQSRRPRGGAVDRGPTAEPAVLHPVALDVLRKAARFGHGFPSFRACQDALSGRAGTTEGSPHRRRADLKRDRTWLGSSSGPGPPGSPVAAPAVLLRRSVRPPGRWPVLDVGWGRHFVAGRFEPEW